MVLLLFINTVYKNLNKIVPIQFIIILEINIEI